MDLQFCLYYLCWSILVVSLQEAAKNWVAAPLLEVILWVHIFVSQVSMTQTSVGDPIAQIPIADDIPLHIARSTVYSLCLRRQMMSVFLLA